MHQSRCCHKCWTICLLALLIACLPKVRTSRNSSSMTPESEITALPVDRSEWSWVDRQGRIRTYQQTQDRIRAIMSEHGIQGLSITLKQGRDWTKNPDVFNFDLGFEDLGIKNPINAMTVFRADRLGQAVVAYLVMRLATDEQFDLDRPLSKYVSKSAVENSRYKELARDRRYSRLTARRILSHRSGLADSLPGHPEREPIFIASPGRGFLYSDEGYSFLQFVLEQKFGKSLDELMQIFVFGPLEMKRTNFSRPTHSDAQVMASTDISSSRDRSDSTSPWIFKTTASDFTKFMWTVRLENPYLSHEAFMSHVVYPTVSIHSRSILDTAFSEGNPALPKKLAWCLGWGTYQIPRVILGACSFIGQKNQGMESYATIFESQHSTALTIFIIPSSSKSALPLILRELLGDMDNPLPWLGF
jgi:CubicO group peptidase (beta-lactamase class C family)